MNENKNFYIAGVTLDNQEVLYTERKFNRLSDEQKKLISEALPQIMYKQFPLVYTFAFDRIVGETALVEVDDYQKDSVFWVYRKSNIKWRVPVVLNGTARKTTYMTMIFQRREGKVFIADCFFGKRTPPLPGNPDARRQGENFVENCRNFWQNHALVIPQNDIDVARTVRRLDEKEAEHFLELIGARNSYPQAMPGGLLFC